MQLKLYDDVQKYREEFKNKWNNKLIEDFETILVKQANSTTFKIDSSLVICRFLFSWLLFSTSN